MSTHSAACFGYRVSHVEGEWLWAAFDPAGRVRAEGRAPTRAVAAACVIRALADQALGADAEDRAA